MQDVATKIVRVGTSAIAYAWNASESKWDQIGRHSYFNTFCLSSLCPRASTGTVVDGPSGSTGGKVQLNGMEYDKVTSFDPTV